MSEQVEELQEKAHHSAKLQKTLELDGSPVAVAIVPELPGRLKQWRPLEHRLRTAPCQGHMEKLSGAT